jgi:arylsulfatase A-like enzyme
MTDKPNFLFFFPDQHRGDWMPHGKKIFKTLGMDPIPLRMPNLSKLMQKGVTFTNAISPSPLCAPARACLASGLRYHNCRVKGNYENYPLNQKTYYSVLRDKGYNVGSVGKLDLHKPKLSWGLNGWIPELEKLGFTHVIDNEGKWDAIRSVIMKEGEKGRLSRVKPENYEPKGPYIKFLHDNDLLITHINDFMKRFGKKNLNSDPTPIPEEAYCDNWLSNNAIEMLNKFPKNKPWHLVVNFTGPHDPWDITERMKQTWENVSFPSPNKGNDKKIEEEIKVRQNYAAMLENIDRNIGLILDEVNKRGELDNTIIIYSSDHGEMLGDFKSYGKTRPYRGSVNIPLVIAGPTINEGVYSNALVELQDLTSTILDYGHAEMPEAKDSQSLRHILEGKDEIHRKFQISALDLSKVGVKEWKMISDGEFKLVVEGGDVYRLYNLKDDPWENNDISEENPLILNKLLKELDLI